MSSPEPGRGNPCLASFHPVVSEWFESNYPAPTPVQAEAWPLIAAGGNVLAIAPTGSGKTLTAFLEAISRLASGDYPASALSVLYISPLKALNEDVRRNLEEPLLGIEALFRAKGIEPPAIRAETRSGDTPQAQRRRFLSKPPSILCTTPESLAILLDSPRARPILAGVKLLIMDEVHAIAGSKRGSILACSVGRLAALAGEFQRVALSATVRPPEAAMDFVAGIRLTRDSGGGAVYAKRPIALVAPAMEKRIEFSVEFPAPAIKPRAPEAPGAGEAAEEGGRYDAVIPAIAGRLKAVRSLLVFTDSRRRAERMAFLLNELEGPGTAYAHHGSLAKEARRVVEERFKSGELRCVVATASLELGIDIGSVDEVILAGAPPEVSAALQRAGRSGHGVGGVSRAVFYPFHGMDLLESAAVLAGAQARDIEALKVPRAPLDILAQVLLSLACEREWKVDELYETVNSYYPFERLPRGLFDATVGMLAGRYASGRLRELEPRIYLDAEGGTLRAREGVRPLLYSSGGAIPDRGHYSMRVRGSGAKIGELDEEFVYERKVGESFTMGQQSWRILDIGAEAVEVAPLGESSDFIPFWKAETRFRSPEASARLLSLVGRLSRLEDAGALALLEGELGFSRPAAEAALSFLRAQAAAGEGRASLPEASRIAIEAYSDPLRRSGPSGAASHGRDVSGGRDAHCVVIHTLRGGAVNEALALALAAAYGEEGGLVPEFVSDDNFILIVLPAGEDDPLGSAPGESAGFSGPEAAGERAARLLRSLGPRPRLEALVRSRLEASGLFGAQFRECAGRALLIPRGGPGKRTPLWVTRLKAKRLFEAVRGRSDFPVTAEAWRSCLVDLFDLDALASLVEGMASGAVELSVFRTRTPSPFARQAIWRETGEYMYRGDAMSVPANSSISDRVIEEALASSRLRPRLDSGLIADFERKAKRLLPGWGPADPFELAEWAKERVLIPSSELPALLASGAAGLEEAFAADPGCGGRLERLVLPGAREEVLVHRERAAALAADPGAFLSEWLRREGPVGLDRMASLFGLSGAGLDAVLAELEESGEIVVDEFRKDSPGVEVIDAENLEILLRLSRKAARSLLPPRPARELFGFVAEIQGLAPGAFAAGKGLEAVLEGLEGYPLPAGLWESEILPLRMARYAPQELDALLDSGRWLWFGSGREAAAFSRADSLELFGAGKRASTLVAGDSPPLDFWSIKAGAGLASREAALRIWKEAWAGSISSEDFSAVRRGLSNRFGKDLPELEAAPDSSAAAGQDSGGRGQRRIPRALRERWRGGAPVQGKWFSLDLGVCDGEARDAVEEEELAAARVRVLASRWGILYRELLERELPGLGWGALFPAMRRMELAGELVYGRFFEGLEGPQFMTPEAYEAFRRLAGAKPGAAANGEARAAVWLNALDPAAEVFRLEAFRAEAGEGRGLRAPERLPGNRLCAMDGLVAAVLAKSGAELELAPHLREAELDAVAAGLASLRARAGRRIAIKVICGVAASAHPFAARLAARGFEADRGSMILW